jgi:hypothetical protein
LSTGILHRAAGLNIAADAPIPGLPRTGAHGVADLHIHLESPAPWRDVPVEVFYRADHVDARQRPMVTVGRTGHGFHFSYADGTAVWIDTAGTHVWCSRAPGATMEDLATYLTGPILGFVLRRRGYLSLHASAVQTGSGATIMAGPHGAGKSTIAAALAMRGCPLITDDVLRVREAAAGWVAEPFAGSLKLWPDSVALVLGPDVSLPRLTPTWDKRTLDVDRFGVRAAQAPVTVHSILLLEWSDSDRPEPEFAAVGTAETVVRLAAHGSSAHLLDADDRAREFHAIADLARGIRATRVVLSPNPRAFGACVDRVHQWARGDEAWV